MAAGILPSPHSKKKKTFKQILSVRRVEGPLVILILEYKQMSPGENLNELKVYHP